MYVKSKHGVHRFQVTRLRVATYNGRRNNVNKKPKLFTATLYLLSVPTLKTFTKCKFPDIYSILSSLIDFIPSKACRKTCLSFEAAFNVPV